MTGHDAPPGPAGQGSRLLLPRRKLVLGLSATAAASYLLIRFLPKGFLSWAMLRRRLPSERNLLETIAAGLPETCRFPYGDEPARVVLARDPALTWENEREMAPFGWDGTPSRERVGTIVDQAVMRLVDRSSPESAWKELFRPDDLVAIKTMWSVHLEVAEPIVRGLISAGVAPEKIVFFDYRPATHSWWQGKPPEPWLPARGGQHRLFNQYRKLYGVSVSGGKYSPEIVHIGSQTTQYEQILYDCTALVNLASLKSHMLAETTVSLKNHQGSHRYPERLHASWDVSCSLLSHADVIRGKTRLVVCDALAPIYNLGPITEYNPYIWKYNGMLVSRDPVALDTIGISILSQKRRETGLPHELPRSHDQLRCAEKIRLGRYRREMIDLVEHQVA